MSVKAEIAAKLEQAFSHYGFAEPSVSKLQTFCGVSLRTLYKYYPSKDEMIVAALEHRHQRYMALLTKDGSVSGLDAVLRTAQTLEEWMTNDAPHGCMSTLAVASFPDNETISKVVTEHKLAVRDLLAELAQDGEKGDQLYLIHEGISTTWPVLGAQSINIAKQMIRNIIEA